MLRTIKTDFDNLLIDDMTIAGRVVPYGERSKPTLMKNGRKVFKVMDSGCFGDSLQEIIDGHRVIFCNVDHAPYRAAADSTSIIGSTAQNIELEDRADGVYFSMTMPDLDSAKDLYKQIKLGFIQGVSVEYLESDQEPSYERDANGDYIKHVVTGSVIFDGFAITSNPRFRGGQVVALNDAEQSEALQDEKQIALIEEPKPKKKKNKKSKKNIPSPAEARQEKEVASAELKNRIEKRKASLLDVEREGKLIELRLKSVSEKYQ